MEEVGLLSALLESCTSRAPALSFLSRRTRGREGNIHTHSMEQSMQGIHARDTRTRAHKATGNASHATHTTPHSPYTHAAHRDR